MTDRTHPLPTPPIPFNHTPDGGLIVTVELPGLLYLLFDAPNAIKRWGTIEWPNGRASIENPEVFPFKVIVHPHLTHDGVIPQPPESVTFQDFVAALNDMARTEPVLYGRILDEAQHDSAVADAMIQFAVFGELMSE
jgi:hypothetical protein